MNTEINAVLIGLENSKKYGNCPGVNVDIKNINNMLKTKENAHGVVLFNETATISNVKQEIKNACRKPGIAFIYYSGHGGSATFYDTKFSIERDGKDEFLCLYDGLFKDDWIWEIIANPNNKASKVFLMFDCCHSETMFRTAGFNRKNLVKSKLPKLITRLLRKTKLENAEAKKRYLSACKKRATRGEGNSSSEQGDVEEYATIAVSNKLNMICWSGCPDTTVSWGSSTGGEFTNALIRALETLPDTATYKDIWKQIKKDKVLKKQQTAKCTIYHHDKDASIDDDVFLS